jgi:uncharacterized PurR-regulated membrane protein YhhQ (DUF165 family)
VWYIIFAVGAFGWTLPWAVVWEIFFFNLIVKYGVTLLSLPLIYTTRDRNLLKKEENHEVRF